MLSAFHRPIEALQTITTPAGKAVLWLRWTLFGSLLAFGAASSQSILNFYTAHVALGALLVLNLALSFLPRHILKVPSLEFSLGLFDTAVISYLVYQSDPSGYLCLFFFTLLITTAVSTRFSQMLLSAFVLSCFYLLLTGIREGFSVVWSAPSLLVLPLFYSTALSFGYQVLLVRDRHTAVDLIVQEKQELRSVLEILESITSSLDFHSVMYRIARHIAEVVGAVRCSVLLVEESPSHQALVVAASDNEELAMLPVDLAKYPEVQLAIDSRKAVMIEDVESHGLLRPHLHHLLRLNFRSILVLPIVFQDSVIGTLFMRASKTRTFTPAEQKFCQVVATAAASAIKNSMLYRKLQERARTQEETANRFRTLFDQSPDVILQLDAQGKVRELNRTTEVLSGRTREKILGKGVNLLIEDLPPLPELLKQAQSKQAPPPREAKLLATEGQVRLLSVTANSLKNAEDEFILIGRDVTEQKHASAILQQREKLSSIGEIVASVAHELNNPLTGVLGFAQLLAHKDTEGRFERDIERIVECSDRCQKIVQNLLSFARPTNPEKKPLGLNGVLEKSLDLLDHSLLADNIEIVRDLAPRLPFVLANFHQIQQVLTNLITNAQHALGSVDRPRKIILRTYAQDDKVTLEVTDNGPGISEEALPRIFDPFFSTKKQGSGTGLGLSVTYGIVQDHGGELLVETSPDRGTTFRAVLPVHEGELPEEVQEKDTPQSGDSRRILVVDDEEVIIELYMHLLQDLGHTIDTASTGIEALRKIEAKEFDLVITDIKMPKMSGIQLYQKAVEAKPKMRNRFIFITGDVNSLNQKQYSTITDNPCLLKPVNIEKIETTIRQVLSEQSSSLDGPVPVN